ncbi:MAG TPA: extracellular solute-binding protein [Phycisphaerales bacterium]|nr:extracellular solute-binding protein [Phycisphaerales bacterium]
MPSPSTISRRGAIGVLAASGLGFLLVSRPGEDERAKGRKVLDYWEKWTGHEGAAMQRVVDAFNEQSSTLYVRYLITNTIHQKALVSILGGAPPDIVGLYAYNVPTYAEANAVLRLNDLAPRHGLRLEDYAPGMRPVMKHGDGWYAAVNTGGTLALYWNRAIFRECADALRAMGLSPDRAPATIRELDLAHEAVTRTTGGKVGSAPLTRAGFLHMEPGWWSWIWGSMFGGTLYDAAADRALAGSPEVVSAYEWVQSYPRALGLGHVEKFRSGFGPYGTPQSAFLTGEVAMVVQGPWMANLIKAFAPDLDYGVAPLPIVDDFLDPDAPLTCIDTDVLMIPRGVKDPEASMEFIAFTQRRENVESLALAHCKGSPLVSVSDDFYAKHTNRGVALHTAMASSAKAFRAPATPVWTEYKDKFDTAMQDMWKLVEPASVRLPVVQAQAQALLDEARSRKLRRGER